mmetsp:Transcript_11346/g.43830  ORF Transcript_11346/g.43830 Transcript_11346/m.43830 type:complete len:361 (-) Transcript_11346:115-1197(-)
MLAARLCELLLPAVVGHGDVSGGERDGEAVVDGTPKRTEVATDGAQLAVGWGAGEGGRVADCQGLGAGHGPERAIDEEVEEGVEEAAGLRLGLEEPALRRAGLDWDGVACGAPAAVGEEVDGVLGGGEVERHGRVLAKCAGAAGGGGGAEGVAAAGGRKSSRGGSRAYRGGGCACGGTARRGAWSRGLAAQAGLLCIQGRLGGAQGAGVACGAVGGEGHTVRVGGADGRVLGRHGVGMGAQADGEAEEHGEVAGSSPAAAGEGQVVEAPARARGHVEEEAERGLVDARAKRPDADGAQDAAGRDGALPAAGDACAAEEVWEGEEGQRAAEDPGGEGAQRPGSRGTCVGGGSCSAPRERRR